MKTVCFVILHYGDIETTEECIASIMQLHGEQIVRIIVVDNDWAKSAEQRELLKVTFSDNEVVDVLQIQEDVGFSRANNIGFAYAKEQYQPDFVVVTNNDIVFAQKDFLIRLFACYAQNKPEVIGPDIISMRTGVHQSPIDQGERTKQQVNYTIAMNQINLWLLPVTAGLLEKRYFGEENNVPSEEMLLGEIAKQDGMQQMDVVPCGACIIYTKAFLENEEKAFWPETKFYYEEYILHARCRMAGYSISYEPKLKVLHGDGVATVKKSKDSHKRLQFMMKHTMESAKIYRKML